MKNKKTAQAGGHIPPLEEPLLFIFLYERPGFAVLSTLEHLVFSIILKVSAFSDSVAKVYVAPRSPKYRVLTGKWGFALTHSTAPKQKACNLLRLFRILAVIEKVYVYLPPLRPPIGGDVRSLRSRTVLER